MSTNARLTGCLSALIRAVGEMRQVVLLHITIARRRLSPALTVGSFSK